PPGPAETPLPKADVHAPAEEHADLTLSPAVRRAVLEHHVDPSKITGTGKDGRITKDDVLAAAEAKEAPSAPAEAGAQTVAKATPAPQADWVPASAGTQRSAGERNEERVKMSRLRQTI